VSRLWILLPWTLIACIEDPAASADPEDPAADMQVDGMLADARTDGQEDVCAAIPICPEGTEQVDVCPDDTCVTGALCGETILCHPTPCMPDLDPCPEGTVPMDASCPQGLECIEVTDACLGFVTICAPTDCECPEGTFPNACDLDEPLCFQIDCGLTCELQCTPPEGCIEVEECRYADDPYCEVVDQCGTACLNPTDCGPGAQPPCAEGVYAADCTLDDPHCVQVHACNSEHWCRLPCPRHTEQVPVCLGGDPACWTLEDGTACMSTGCYPMNDEAVCVDWVPVDACESDAIPDLPEDACGMRFLCGYEALCVQRPDRPCEDGIIDCGPNARASGRCAPDGRACTVHPSCNGLLFCVACPPDDPNCDEG
jgi:hypothetical protein